MGWPAFSVQRPFGLERLGHVDEEVPAVKVKAKTERCTRTAIRWDGCVTDDDRIEQVPYTNPEGPGVSTVGRCQVVENNSRYVDEFGTA